MRLNFNLTSAALFAVAGLFAIVAAAPAANAFTFGGIDPAASPQFGAETVHKVVITRDQAREARRNIRQSFRADCRNLDTRSERRACRREARDEFRDLRNQARSAYFACRLAGGSRSDCRQERRSFWLSQSDNSGGGDATDTTGGTGDDINNRGED